MRWIGFSIAALASALVGCSTFPLPDDVTRKSTYDIVQQIRCEARRAVADHAYDYKTGIDYKTASVAYEFDFDISEDNNASADATWTLPYTLGGSLSLVANAGLNRNRHTKRNFKIVDSFDELLQINCADDRPQENIIYPIAGDIGVYEVVRTFIKLQQIGNPKSGEVFTFGDTLMFTTLLTGGVQPKLIISPLTDRFRLAGADADFNARRNDVHTVTLALAGSPPKTSKPIVGASLRSSAAGLVGSVGLVGLQTNSSLVSTTIIQSATNPKDRALIELDRQRILALQARTPNLLVGP
jgi:hypothetical protein